MKRYYEVPCLLALVCVLFTSCLKSNEDELELSDEAAITQFTLGNLKQIDSSTATETTLTGSLYKMAIDQINNRIFNKDSLPVGTVVSETSATVTTRSSSVVAIRLLSDTTMFEFFNSGVAYDFSVPRTLRTYATDGSYYRDYIVTLNVKKSKGTAFWTAQADTTLMGNYTDMRLLNIDTTLVVLGSDGNKTELCRSTDKGKTWTKDETLVLDADAWKNAVVSGDSLFVLSDSQLKYTRDLNTWTALTNSWNLKQLVAADSKEIFALTADSLLKSAMAGTPDSWKDEQIDDALDLQTAKKQLAAKAIASVSFPYTALAKTDYVLMMGHDDTNTVAWRKISSYGKPENTGRWVSIPYQTNGYRLPKQDRLALLQNGASILAVGHDTPVYESTDQGITWRINTTFTLPKAMQAAAIDVQGVLWGISVDDGKATVWRGSQY